MCMNWRMDKLWFRLKSKAFLALIVVVALSGCSLLPAEEEPLKPPLVKPPQENYRTTPVVKGAIAQEVKGNGTLESYFSDAVEFTAEGGRVKEVFVRAGDDVKKGDPLVQLDVGDMDVQLRTLEMNMLISRKKLREARIADDEEGLRIAQLQYEIDQIKYTRLQDSYSNKQLVATMDGRVTFVAPLVEGDVVKPYETIVMISDPNKLRISFQIDTSSDAMKVTVGFNASLKFGTEIVEGKVTQTPSSAPQTDDEILRSRYASHVYVETESLPESATIGTKADVTIRLQEKESVLLIPRSGLRNYLGRTFVRILEEGDKIREVDVEQGIIGSTEVEITKGLEEGQLIVLQ
ncbi:biotin/lipoyl-binding protein [Paenibacillus pinisoli]|uniref:Biotin/lipoyl-binding protein n=1 Tax=Paenibacillus pinisoli TaxID=1276110 RepID=A0A3A6PIH7_9BACL|nr:biotin/lipoyl-binding protein [Paenibacillus pinisoli]